MPPRTSAWDTLVLKEYLKVHNENNENSMGEGVDVLVERGGPPEAPPMLNMLTNKMTHWVAPFFSQVRPTTLSTGPRGFAYCLPI